MFLSMTCSQVVVWVCSENGCLGAISPQVRVCTGDSSSRGLWADLGRFVQAAAACGAVLLLGHRLLVERWFSRRIRPFSVR